MVQGKSVTTIVVFILSIIFVIQPVMIPFGRGKYKGIPLNFLTAPILAIVILWASNCLVGTTIRNGIVGTDGLKPYNILIILFSLAYMSVTLDVTGVLEAAAHWVNNASSKNGVRFYVSLYLMTTAILENDPFILSGTLFLIYYMRATQLEPNPWLIPELAAAIAAIMVLLPGNPTIIVICEGFGIKNAVFTILPFVACSVICMLPLIFQYNDAGLERDERDARSYIKDPVGAVVGSILLGGCLITALVVSFPDVDVWKITLSFAGAKLLFDIVRDLHRTRTREAGTAKFDQETPDIGDMAIDSDESSVLNDPIKVRTDSLPHSDAPDSFVVHAPTKEMQVTKPRFAPLGRMSKSYKELLEWTKHRQPTLFDAFPRLPFALIPFAFSQFVMIEALAGQGWIRTFAHWLDVASGNKMLPATWIIGAMSISLCDSLAVTIAAKILLIKVVRAVDLSAESTQAAGVALALASNAGIISLAFTSSLVGLLSKRTNAIKQRKFAGWNLLILLVLSRVALAVVSAEIAVIFRQPTEGLRARIDSVSISQNPTS